MCQHEIVNFNPSSEKDKFPGGWKCEDCGEEFRFDPLGRTSVKYLDKPNPKQDKELPEFKVSRS